MFLSWFLCSFYSCELALNLLESFVVVVVILVVVLVVVVVLNVIFTKEEPTFS